MTKYLSSYIINAVKKGNLKAVQRFLKLHKNNKALLNACEEYKVGFGLFSIGDASGWNMDHLPHIAIRSGQMQILAELAACEGIDINAVNRDYLSPLKLAVSYRNLQAVAILLGSPNIDIDAVDLSGDTALILAVRMGDLAIVKLLLEHGASKEIKNQLGYDVIKESQAFGRDEIYQFLVAGASAAQPNTGCRI